MKWGAISHEFSLLGWKRLSSHEIDPSVSHGHEFQGVSALKHLLGTTDRKEIPADYYLLNDEEGHPAVAKVIRSTASWYDSRAKQPQRSPEWRLYYPAEVEIVQKNCASGDLVIIGERPSGILAIFLIPQNSETETFFSNLLEFAASPEVSKGKFVPVAPPDVDMGLPIAAGIEQLALSMASIETNGAPPPFPVPDWQPEAEDHSESVAEELLKQWASGLPGTQIITSLVEKRCGFTGEQIRETPDEVLLTWLETAEVSYRIWEKAHLSAFVSPLRFDDSINDVNFAEEVSQKWMSLRQGRVSRAGRVMELFLCRIFDSWGVSYQWQAMIEGGKKPDFLLPGTKEYETPDFPAEKLRILGSKTSLKDRWRQILDEGQRVQTKHGVTRDMSITRSMFTQMKNSQFCVVMPSPLIQKYQYRPENLISLTDFLKEIKEIQGSSNQFLKCKGYLRLKQSQLLIGFEFTFPDDKDFPPQID